VKEIDEEEMLSRKYLLDELDDGEREQVEERLINDPEYFERVVMLEDELVEDYAFNVLSDYDHNKVAQRLLSTPQQIHKLEMTRAIKQYSETDEAESPFPLAGNRFVAFLQGHKLAVGLSSAASLLLAFVLFWALTRDPLQQELARLNRASESSDQPASDPDRTDPSIYPINLTARRFRNIADAVQDERKKAVIPPEARVVQLRVLLATDYSQSYRVVLEKDDEEKVFSLDNLQAVAADGGKLLAIKLPAGILGPGYYQLIISKPGKYSEQFDDIGSYDFQVVDKK
jgi:anti-sigma factor RsiW